MMIGTSFLGAPQTVQNPQGAVHGSDQGLDPVTLVTVQVTDNLREVEDVHEHCRHRSNASQDGEELCVEFRFCAQTALGEEFCAEVEVLCCSAMDVLLYVIVCAV